MNLILAILIGGFIGGFLYFLIKHLIWKNGIPTKVEKFRWLISILFLVFIIAILLFLKDTTSWEFLKHDESIKGIGFIVTLSTVAALKNYTKK